MLHKVLRKNIISGKFLQKSPQLFVASRRNYAKEKKTDPKAELKKRGEALDRSYLETKSPVERILRGKETEKDITFDYKNPEEFARWLNVLARDGPEYLISRKPKPEPVVITITGAAGSIAYSLIPRIAGGDLINQPIILKLLEVPGAMKALEGVVMELEDLAMPLVEDIVATSDVEEAFKDCDIAFLVGAKPRTKGQERGDLLKDNAKIFAEQGKALDKVAKSDVIALVVGNPANTNAMILSANAPNIDPRNITAMTRLDHDRALAQIAQKANCKLDDIDRFCIWGNHSSTQYPDVSNTSIKGKWLRNVIKDEDWIYNTFIPTVQNRGAEIIAARGKSSAASAANAAINHVRDLILGHNKWLSMAIPTDGTKSQYGIPYGIWCSMPVLCTGAGKYDTILGIEFDKRGHEAIQKSINELLAEKEAVESLLPPKQFYFAQVDDKVYSFDWIKTKGIKI